MLLQSAVDLAGYPALDGADVQEKLSVRRKKTISLDHERRWTGVQPSVWIRSVRRRCHGGSC